MNVEIVQKIQDSQALLDVYSVIFKNGPVYRRDKPE